jgi:hypothetical protein
MRIVGGSRWSHSHGKKRIPVVRLVSRVRTPLTKSLDFTKDQIGGRRPEKRFRVAVPLIQVVKQSLLQRSNRGMASTANASFRHLCEQSFHQVQPTATGWREVDVIARVTRQPQPHLIDPMGAVVVHD